MESACPGLSHFLSPGMRASALVPMIPSPLEGEGRVRGIIQQNNKIEWILLRGAPVAVVPVRLCNMFTHVCSSRRFVHTFHARMVLSGVLF